MSKFKFSSKSNFKPYLISVLFGTLVTVVILLLLGLILVNNTDFNLFIKIMMYGSLFFSGFVSGYYLNKKLKGRGYVNGFFAGLLNALFSIVVITALLNFNFSVNILLILPVVVLGGVVGGIVRANK